MTPAQRTNLPGAAHLLLPDGVRHLDEEQAVFDAMLEGWKRQQQCRLLAPATIKGRVDLVRRFQAFSGRMPWQWQPTEVEDFTSLLLSGDRPRAHSTIRGYQVDLALFMDYITDRRYDWADQCLRRFGEFPVQIFHKWNTAEHLAEFEGRPEVRPLTYDEIEALFDHADGRVATIVAQGRKGALAALRDAQMVKTMYAFGLRRRELVRMDVADLRCNAKAKQWGSFGSVHVRWGKAMKGSAPRRRTVLTVPEFDWVVEGLEHYLREVRPRFGAGAHPALWVNERANRVSCRDVDRRFAALRDDLDLPRELHAHCLRHSYVTHLIEFGYPERFVQEQVGHSYASTTAIYASVSNDFKNQVLATALKRVYADDGPPTP